MTVGTLRDQVTYPDSHEEQMRKGTKDEELADILNKVRWWTNTVMRLSLRASLLEEIGEGLFSVTFWH